jgi:hypothetical protein
MKGNGMEKCGRQILNEESFTDAGKAFIVLEAIFALESALWDLYYNEFMDKCAEKSEELERERMSVL